MLRPRLELVAACTTIAVVSAGTAAVQARVIPLGALASSPRKAASFKLWALVSDGTLVQRPILLSLISFALLIFLALELCGPRLTLAAAAAGHVCSTLLAYSLVAVVEAVDGGARSLLTAPDYGVSAIQAAWVGAIAAVIWRREGQTAHGRGLVVLGCMLIGGVAVFVRSDLTLVDTDHVFAFAIGATLVALRAPRARRVTRSRRRAPSYASGSAGISTSTRSS